MESVVHKSVTSIRPPLARVFPREAREEDPMKRTLAMLALFIGLGAGALSAQTRVSVSLSFGAPFVAYRPQPYRYHSYRYHSYRVYDSRPTYIVVRPRAIHRAPRILIRRQAVVVLRHRPRRHHRGW